MVPVAVRLSDSELAELDAFIEQGRFSSRTEALRSALRAMLAAERERDLAELYRRAYTAIPETEEERQWAQSAAAEFFNDPGPGQ